MSLSQKDAGLYDVLRTDKTVHFIRSDGNCFASADMSGSAVVLLKDELNALLRETRELRKKMKNQRRALRYHERFRRAYDMGSGMRVYSSDLEGVMSKVEHIREENKGLREQVAKLMRENATLRVNHTGAEDDGTCAGASGIDWTATSKHDK